MQDQLRVVLDAMGGDNAPAATVEGAVEAVRENGSVTVILTGQTGAIEDELKKYGGKEAFGGRIRIEEAPEIIEMAEPPVAAIMKKKNSSIVVGMKMLRRGEAEAFVSAGSTGAVLAGGQTIVGRLKGVHRPPLACMIPTEKGMSLIVDCGANVDARPSWLLQFAKMGSIYMRQVMKIDRPRVGILNIGAEEEKGNALVKETFPILKECGEINFTGSVEARDVPSGCADVIVTDAFAGNVLLKMYEGTAAALLRIVKGAMMSSVKGKIGGLLVKKPLKECLKAYDASNYGGAPLLGLKGLVVKTHGSSKAKEIRNSILQCCAFYEADTGKQIEEMLEREKETSGSGDGAAAGDDAAASEKTSAGVTV